MKEKLVKFGAPIIIIIILVILAVFQYYSRHNKLKNNDTKETDKTDIVTEIPKEEVKTDIKGTINKTSEATYVSTIERNIIDRNFKEAQKVSEEALVKYPKSEKILSDYVGVLSASGQTQKAIDVSDTLIKLYPKNYIYWKMKAQLVRSVVKLPYSEEKKAEVIKIYEDALVATGNNIEIISTYAVFAEDYISKIKAIELWQLAQKINPTGAQSYKDIINRLSGSIVAR